MTTKPTKYFEAVGRRKTSTARVRITPSDKMSYVINDRSLDAYFPTLALQNNVTAPITTSKPAEKFSISVKVVGGGISSQSEAVRHGIARALLEYDKELRGSLKKSGYLKRDPRAKERRKFGLKKARKSPQWSKR
jgi:small subunit ribosomal protein S9